MVSRRKAVADKSKAISSRGIAIFAALLVSCNSALTISTRVLTNSFNSSFISAMIEPKFRSCPFLKWVPSVVVSIMITSPDTKGCPRDKAGDCNPHDQAQRLFLRNVAELPSGVSPAVCDGAAHLPIRALVAGTQTRREFFGSLFEAHGLGWLRERLCWYCPRYDFSFHR